MKPGQTGRNGPRPGGRAEWESTARDSQGTLTVLAGDVSHRASPGPVGRVAARRVPEPDNLPVTRAPPLGSGSQALPPARDGSARWWCQPRRPAVACDGTCRIPAAQRLDRNVRQSATPQQRRQRVVVFEALCGARVARKRKAPLDTTVLTER